MRVWYTSLQMVLCSHAEHPNFQLAWEKLKEFYEEFLFGLQILGRRDPPPLWLIMRTERASWARIITLTWGKKLPLQKAFDKVRKDARALVAFRNRPRPSRRMPTKHKRKAKENNNHSSHDDNNNSFKCQLYDNRHSTKSYNYSRKRSGSKT